MNKIKFLTFAFLIFITSFPSQVYSTLPDNNSDKLSVNSLPIPSFKGLKITKEFREKIQGKNNMPIRYVHNEVIVKFKHGSTENEVKKMFSRHTLEVINGKNGFQKLVLCQGCNDGLRIYN